MKTRILLADDHRMMRDGLRMMLDEQPGLEVVGEVGDGRSAVERARELSPEVVVMDVTMPVLNGVEAARQIAASGAATRVVGLSMHRERQFVLAMLEAGAAGYVLKDSPVEELVGAIEAAARGEVYMCPKVAAAVIRRLVAPGGAGGGGHAGAVGEGRRFCGRLTPREREVLQLLSEGLSAKEVAARLHIGVKTAETHRRQIMEKLDLHSVAELTRYAIREGLTALG